MLTVVTVPAVQPIELADVKAHLRITGSREDDTLGRYIAGSVSALEERLRRSLITRRYALEVPAWPGDEWPIDAASVRLRRCVDDREGQRLRLPRPPIQRLVAVETVTADGTATALTGLLLVDGAILRPDTGWPELATGDRIRVTFEAGHGASASTMPADVQHALRLYVGDMYLNREPSTASPDAPGTMALFHRRAERWSI
ncbi:MAG: phage head-tail connector protein [Gemmatimonadetes bacterium]|nr:phage head-tail connector protein [Candidatus Palauibacter rhopaloidicola]